ncbi:MAG: MFS transporter [Rubrivivax sp.]|nr:MFS transporter [Rubrivivax sp.]
MRLWSARALGVAAQQMMMVALGWQLYELTGSAWDLGLLGLVQFVPAFGLVLVAGQVVDRVHRARLMALCFALQAAVALMLVAAVHGGWLQRELILALAFVLGAVRAFQMPAQQAIVPLLVPAAVLPRALAFSSMGLQGAIIGGPALGGLVYGAGALILYATCSVGMALAALLCLRVRHAPPQPRALAERHSWLAGVHYVRSQPVLLGAMALDLFAVLLGSATALLPIFAKDILHVGPQGLGLLRGAPAAGALAMSLWLTRHPISRRAGPRLLAAVVAYGAAMVVFGLSSLFWLSLLALAVSGAADMVSVVVRNTLVQLETPDEMRGRVSAVNSLFIGASSQLGEFESGATAALLGPVGSVVLGGFGAIALALLWPRWFPALARRDALVSAPTSARPPPAGP